MAKKRFTSTDNLTRARVILPKNIYHETQISWYHVLKVNYCYLPDT